MRIPFGILGLLLALAIYGLAVLALLPWIERLSPLGQAPVYLVLGILWLLPLRRYLIWMETGRWG